MGKIKIIIGIIDSIILTILLLMTIQNLYKLIYGGLVFVWVPS